MIFNFILEASVESACDYWNGTKLL